MKTWKVLEEEAVKLDAHDLEELLNALETSGWSVVSVHQINRHNHEGPFLQLLASRERSPDEKLPDLEELEQQKSRDWRDYHGY